MVKHAALPPAMATFTSVPFRRQQGQMGGGRKNLLKGISSKIFGNVRDKVNMGKEVLKNKQARNELMKRAGKKAAKEVAKGAVSVGGDLLIDYALGGEAPNAQDVKSVSKTTGLQLAKNRLSGQKVTGDMVHRELRRANRQRMQSKPKKRKARLSLAERLLRLQLYAEKRRRKKKSKRTRGYRHRILKYRAFGTGAGAKKRRGKKKKKGGRKRKPSKKRTAARKSPKRRGKKTKKRRPRRVGLKKMNIGASRARFMKMRDVFDIE